VVALLVPVGLALIGRQWWAALHFGIGLGGAWFTGQGITQIWWRVIQSHTVSGAALVGLVKSLALTMDPISRWSAILTLFLIGIPTTVGLIYLLVKLFRSHPTQPLENFHRLVWFSIIAFCGSWLGWYVLLSIGWVRYAMPATLVGSLLVAQMFSDLTQQFNLRTIVIQTGEAILRLRLFTRKAIIVWMMVIVILMVGMTIQFSYRPLFGVPDLTPFQAVDYLQNNTPAGSRVECYESGILFLLDRPYHYPPDQVSADILQLNGGSAARLGYDALAADPDYLVVGPFARGVGLYDQAVESGELLAMTRIGDFDLYRRMR
jgi:hypothetical protein